MFFLGNKPYPMEGFYPKSSTKKNWDWWLIFYYSTAALSESDAGRDGVQLRLGFLILSRKTSRLMWCLMKGHLVVGLDIRFVQWHLTCNSMKEQDARLLRIFSCRLNQK